MISEMKLINNLIGILLYFVYSSCGFPSQCSDFEILQCNNGAHQMMFCSAKKANTRPVASVHVDLRHETRHCHAQGEAQNFGLTAAADQMWTAHWCYGTFILCYQSEYKDSPEDQSDESSTTTHILTNTAVSTSPENDNSGNFTSHNNVTKEIGPPRSDDDHGNSLSGIDSEADQQHISFEQDESSNTLDDKLKFWLLFGIVAGGVIIIVLIAVITYVVVKCETNTKARQYGTSRSICETRYYRGEKPSVTELLDNDENMYADIGTCERFKCEDTSCEQLNCEDELGKDLNRTIKQDNNTCTQAMNKQLCVNTAYSENVYDHVIILPAKRCSIDNVYNRLYVGDSSDQHMPSIEIAIPPSVDVV
ncbi:uncharacterized protein LOC127860253 [Dreissena polymorpha]|uniref:Uncharacterized protein n=1 Tax=Dreissena polymorpha TaxID=45954 RepID=A0A9D4BKM9_DREPO|nr:uncharacterized protein LOC127860253 [Dreissena polymorpha]KAH3699469.1 hypothetical protein DPMN_074425 [Dreissena polymorpha]